MSLDTFGRGGRPLGGLEARLVETVKKWVVVSK
jgi:hypothetical protein